MYNNIRLPVSHRAEPWPIRLARRLPIPYGLFAFIPGVLILLPGLLLYRQEVLSVTPGALPVLSRLITAALVITYILLMMRYLYRATAQTLVRLRSAVLVDDDEYARLSHTMLTVDRRVDQGLVVVGLLAAVGALIAQYAINEGFRMGLQRSPLTHSVIMIGETLMTLLVALFVYTGFERGIALYRLFLRPLSINAFDHSRLAPFSELSLNVTLAQVGLVSLPVVVWWGYRFGETMPLLIFISAILSAFVVFLLPLWGAHLQMTKVREREIQANSARIYMLYREIHDRVDRQVDGRDVADEVNALVQFQRLLENAPTWPYQTLRIGFQLATPIALPLVINLLQQVMGQMLP